MKVKKDLEDCERMFMAMVGQLQEIKKKRIPRPSTKPYLVVKAYCCYRILYSSHKTARVWEKDDPTDCFKIAQKDYSRIVMNNK